MILTPNLQTTLFNFEDKYLFKSVGGTTNPGENTDICIFIIYIYIYIIIISKNTVVLSMLGWPGKKWPTLHMYI